MKRLPVFALCATFYLSANAAEDNATQKPTQAPISQQPFKTTLLKQYSDPLLAPSKLPFAFPDFAHLQPEQFEARFSAAMQYQLELIKYVEDNSDAPTFSNTIELLEIAYQPLQRASRLFYNLNSTLSSPEMQAISIKIAPILSAHQDSILLNPTLFKRVKTLYQQDQASGQVNREKYGSDVEKSRLIERYYKDMVRAGANLSPDNQTKLKKINSELAKLGALFNQNVLKELNASAILVDERQALAGLSETQINSAAELAKTIAKTEPNNSAQYAIALTNTTIQPVLSQLTSRALRQRIFEASLARGSRGGDFDNAALILNIATLRAQKAQLLGYENYAAYMLENGTAKTPLAVNKLLAQLAPAALENAKKEAALLQKMIDQEAQQNHTQPFALAAWDWSFYAEKRKKAQFNFDESQLRPYFELNNVLENGVFFAANQLYGIHFKERHDLPVYHPSIKVYDVLDADLKPLAIFIADMYARSNKRGGAWMNVYESQAKAVSNMQIPIVANHLNVPVPPAGEPTLLTVDEVNTLFHEFGHALHGMFSDVNYPTFAGTSVPRDFVEFPSQVNEMWAFHPTILKNYAKLYDPKTKQFGATMPEALIQKLTNSKKFNQGYDTTAYLSAAILDQHWHQLTPSNMPQDVKVFEAAALKQAGLDYPLVPPRYRTTYFSHIFGGGYAASYYAYIWAEILDADTVQWFTDNGGLKRENGDRFRQELLSKGDSIDVMQAYRNFRGQDAVIAPLLERRGLLVNK